MHITTRGGGIRHGGLNLKANTTYDVPNDLATYFISLGWAFDPENPDAGPMPDVDAKKVLEVKPAKHANKSKMK